MSQLYSPIEPKLCRLLSTMCGFECEIYSLGRGRGERFQVMPKDDRPKGATDFWAWQVCRPRQFHPTPIEAASAFILARLWFELRGPRQFSRIAEAKLDPALCEVLANLLSAGSSTMPVQASTPADDGSTVPTPGKPGRRIQSGPRPARKGE